MTMTHARRVGQADPREDGGVLSGRQEWIPVWSTPSGDDKSREGTVWEGWRWIWYERGDGVVCGEVDLYESVRV